jgi:hypothetical protein
LLTKERQNRLADKSEAMAAGAITLKHQVLSADIWATRQPSLNRQTSSWRSNHEASH